MSVSPYQTFPEERDDRLQEGQKIQGIAVSLVLRKVVIERGL
ncbi:MAG: hypothetical protein OEZ41_02630 [Nitrospirota bacterium]|nr:hypothetical protein [Nitrospirota bacterium]